MGYTTEFSGQIEITPALPAELVKYINDFGNTRRMKRNTKAIESLFAGNDGFQGRYGKDAEYYIGDAEVGIIDYNTPPSDQPGLWCQWVVTDDGKYIEWDGSEKFYESEEWMRYIINNFIGRDYSCNGQIEAQGEDRDDHWMLLVEDNIVFAKPI